MRLYGMRYNVLHQHLYILLVQFLVGKSLLHNQWLKMNQYLEQKSQWKILNRVFAQQMVDKNQNHRAFVQKNLDFLRNSQFLLINNHQRMLSLFEDYNYPLDILIGYPTLQYLHSGQDLHQYRFQFQWHQQMCCMFLMGKLLDRNYHGLVRNDQVLHQDMMLNHNQADKSLANRLLDLLSYWLEHNFPEVH